MKVKVKKMHPDAVLPTKVARDGGDDFCFDVTAVAVEEVAPHFFKYDIGLAFEIERPFDMEDMDLSIDIRPRSSIWKTGMRFCNCTGTVDEGYRNSISLIFEHTRLEMPKYEVGDRVGQIKIGIAPKVTFEWADELSESSRGLKGYGSTGR